MHVDDFIDYGVNGKDEPHEKYARWVLNYFRLSAICHDDFAPFMKENELYCMFDSEQYRVTGASRLGDVWLTKDFSQKTGYQKRVNVQHCSGWSADPK